MKRHRFAWYLWAIGTVLIALSWFSVVSNTVGWIGFAIGMVGSVIGWGFRPPAVQETQDQESKTQPSSNEAEPPPAN